MDSLAAGENHSMVTSGDYADRIFGVRINKLGAVCHIPANIGNYDSNTLNGTLYPVLCSDVQQETRIYLRIFSWNRTILIHQPTTTNSVQIPRTRFVNLHVLTLPGNEVVTSG